MCLPFPTAGAAKTCVEYVTSPNRPDGMDTIPAEEIQIRIFQFHIPLYCVFVPTPKLRLAMLPIWNHAGMGISSRRAEDAHPFLSQLRELEASEEPSLQAGGDKAAATLLRLRERIAGLLERTPSPRKVKVAADDIYLSQTGMASIFYAHSALLKWSEAKTGAPGKTVMFGFPFHSTIHIFEHWGPGVKFLALGTELEELEAYLESESQAGSPVQAVWTELPSNPLLVSSDLVKLRELADKYRFALVVDDTIASFANVDVLPVADVVATSLTKSFSGYADVMGGSVALNPSGPLYNELKTVFNKHYRQELYYRDAEVLLSNSENYLARSATLNQNATLLVDYLQSKAVDKTSSVSRLYYPTTQTTLANYDKFKRPATADFVPGYGCLFSVEFESVETITAFYDNLHVHCGPHLGAHRTLALPYVRMLYGSELEKVAPYDLRPTQLRVSVGLEASSELLAVFAHALSHADAVKAKAGKAAVPGKAAV